MVVVQVVLALEIFDDVVIKIIITAKVIRVVIVVIVVVITVILPLTVIKPAIKCCNNAK